MGNIRDIVENAVKRMRNPSDVQDQEGERCGTLMSSIRAMAKGCLD